MSQELPDELQTLVEEARVVINPQQAQDFRQLLLDYRDVFSNKDEPLGQSDVIQHDIQTTGEPLKSQYCRIPVGLRGGNTRGRQDEKARGVRNFRVPRLLQLSW